MTTATLLVAAPAPRVKELEDENHYLFDILRFHATVDDVEHMVEYAATHDVEAEVTHALLEI